MSNVLSVTGLDANKASKLANELGILLADFQIHYSNLRGYHWHVVGKQFFTLHSHLEKMYDAVAEVIDEIAERILQLGGLPENRFSQYLQQSEIKETHNVSCADAIVEEILASYRILIARERAILDLADEAGDEVTTGLIGDLLTEQEKTTWLLSAYCTK